VCVCVCVSSTTLGIMFSYATYNLSCHSYILKAMGANVTRLPHLSCGPSITLAFGLFLNSEIRKLILSGDGSMKYHAGVLIQLTLLSMLICL
jgi:hypothetical protein